VKRAIKRAYLSTDALILPVIQICHADYHLTLPPTVLGGNAYHMDLGRGIGKYEDDEKGGRTAMIVSHS
jgi:hypothetical protein